MALTLKIEKTLINNVYSTKLSLVELTAGDDELMTKFGEPKVDFGGLVGTLPAPNGYVLPNLVRGLKNGFPVIQAFDKNVEANAESYSTLWLSQATSRITAAMNTLGALSDSFTSQTEQDF